EATVQLRTLRGQAAALSRAHEIAEGLLEQAARERIQATPDGGQSSPSSTTPLEELRTLVARAERGLVFGVDQSSRELEQVRSAAESMRLVRAEVLFNSLERAVRDVADALEKEARFSGTGGDVRIDARMVRTLESALAQLVRNAVAHGIELRRERVA